MELDNQLSALASKIRDHREILLTEEAAKNALVMPFLSALGFDVFNPSEVVPEFTADVGVKKGEKVDYAINIGGEVRILVECKPANKALTLENASQLYRYFSVTNARFAILTNGCEFSVYTDLVSPNKMDARPFFKFSLIDLSRSDIRTLAKFQKSSFDEDGIIRVASSLQLETSVAAYLRQQMSAPDDDFIKLVASDVHEGRATGAVREQIGKAIANAFGQIVNETIKDKLQSAMTPVESEGEPEEAAADIETTEEEIEGFHIVRAIASKLVSPDRIVMRDAKSYCAILLDDNNRKSIARLHFNSASSKYVGTFNGKDETRHAVERPVDIYQQAKAIEARIRELDSEQG